MKMASEDQHVEESTEEQLNRVWSSLNDHNGQNACLPQRKWPTYDELLSNVAAADYHDVLTCPHDMKKSSANEKAICAFGAVCCAKMELFPQPMSASSPPAYTGLLAPGTTLEHCIIRLSSAIKPPSLEIKAKWARALMYATGEKLRNAKLFPTAAVKVFRQNRKSGNLLFVGCKVGQKEEDYFAHCLCTQMTEQIPFSIKPFVRKFWSYSDYPLALGVSDFCHTDNVHEVFPYQVILKPCHSLEHNQTATRKSMDSFDRFLDDVLHIPVGTHLFDIFCCPDPRSATDPSKLQRIGKVMSTTRMLRSAPNDGLFFRHQKKEEDFEKRPEWMDQLPMKCTTNGGKTKGTVQRLAGWKLFEEQIAKGQYVDYETAAVVAAAAAAL